MIVATIVFIVIAGLISIPLFRKESIAKCENVKREFKADKKTSKGGLIVLALMYILLWILVKFVYV